MNVVFLKEIKKFWKRRSNPNTLLIFCSLNTLFQNFFNNHCKISFGLFILGFIEVHTNRNKRSLAITCKQCVYLILNCLNTTFYLFLNAFVCNFLNKCIEIINISSCKLLCNFLTDSLSTNFNKWSKMSQCNRLTTILIACNLCHNLCADIASCCKTMRFFNQCIIYNSSILQHIFQIPQVTVVHVLCKIICIMKMNDTCSVSFHDIMW